MNKLVSAIVPCFNAERWLTEAIDSCLHQTYPRIEIIVIDDGSTDNSLQIIQRYGDRIIWETGPNLGGNAARNRGFALSTGEYIQYLDADDYLLPNKIDRQVRFLEETAADIVYGDLKYQHHLPDGQIWQQETNLLGTPPPHQDVLECLLAYGNLSPSPYLFSRKAICLSEGWDERLRAGQDRDFLISLLVGGATIKYQSGYYSIYRRYGDITVSTANKTLLFKNLCKVLEKAEAKLLKRGQLSPKYKRALANSYYSLIGLHRDRMNWGNYWRLLAKILLLSPSQLLAEKLPRPAVNLIKF